MTDKGLLTICVVCASGVGGIEEWGKGVCMAMEEEARAYPEAFQPFTKSAFAKSGADEGVVVLHALVPEDEQAAYLNALAVSCGISGQVGACIVSVDAGAPADYAEGIAQLRSFKAKGGSPEDLADIDWVRVVPMTGGEEGSMHEATRAVMLFIDFLDVQFDFADDIERFLQAQRNGASAGMPDYLMN